jgi:hypothetical protein
MATTPLQEAAIAACIKARSTHPDGATTIAAFKYLREATGLGLQECKPLIEWAMPRSQSAADLPDGSIVARGNVALIKNHPAKFAQWRSTQGAYCSDSVVDDYLGDGATVLRVGA